MTTSKDLESPESKAVRLLGGPVAAARTLGAGNYQTVQGWIKNGIPAKYCLRIESLTGVGRRELRRSDWADYWPELAVRRPEAEAKAEA